MDLIYKSFAVSFVIGVLILVWKFFNWGWLRPKKIEKILRNQGFSGNSYKFFSGDIRELVKLLNESKSRPIALSDDILPRVMPGHVHALQKFGKNAFVWLGPRPLVYVMDPDNVKEILNKNFKFQKVKGGNPLPKLLATGLVYYEGDKWVKHRKIINPAFHVDKLKNMLPAMYLSCVDVLKKWETMVSSDGNCEVDVYQYLETLTSDVISRTSFGSSYEEGRTIFQLQKEQAALIIQVSQSIYIPGMSLLPTKANKRIKETAKQVKAALRSIIDKRLKAIEDGETNHDDLLGILLDSNSKEVKKHGNKLSFGMTIDEVIEECKLFYFAGQETTSNTLVWVMILLSQHQDWQKRARDEVLEAFGNNKPDLDGLNRLKVVNMILLEVLRLYPPVVALARSINEETKLGEITFPPGVIFQIPVLLMHHDKELWGDDAKEFNPGRFSEGLVKVTKGKASYLPFSWGPRICIGQNFAILEAKMAMAMILQRFSFELSPSYTHAPHTVITLQPQHGAHLILHSLHS